MVDRIKIMVDRIKFYSLGKSTEHLEQAAVLEWANLLAPLIPELRLLFCIPNGAWLAGNERQRVAQAAKLKKEGLKPGVPDLCLPVARRGYHGLYIEMKHGKNRLSLSQKSWLDALTDQGYLAVAVWGAGEAIEVLAEYISFEDIALEHIALKEDAISKEVDENP